MKNILISSLAVPMLIGAVSPVNAQITMGEAFDEDVVIRPSGRVSFNKPATRPHVEDVFASSIQVAEKVYHAFQAREFTNLDLINLLDNRSNRLLNLVLIQIALDSKINNGHRPTYGAIPEFLPAKKAVVSTVSPVVSAVSIEEKVSEKAKSSPTITPAAPIEPSNEGGFLSTASKWITSGVSAAFNAVSSAFKLPQAFFKSIRF
jgi:hypothetical protein